MLHSTLYTLNDSMCGIILSLTLLRNNTKHHTNHHLESLQSPIRARGPDSLSTFNSRFAINEEWDIEVTITASVLGLRGDHVVSQPRVGSRGVLAWNGQIFFGLDVGLHENDTDKLFGELEETQGDPISILSRIEGPYAFIYYERNLETIFFQVDPLSRRSLLIPADDIQSCKSLTFCSVQSNWGKQNESPMRSLEGGEGGVIDLRKISLLQSQKEASMNLSSALTLRRFQDAVQGPFTHVAPLNRMPAPDAAVTLRVEDVEGFIQVLSESVRRRVENIPVTSSGKVRVAILFSGGVDCSLLAALVHQHLPLGEPIDLLNVAFADDRGSGHTVAELFDVPDRISGRASLEELQAACAGREWRFVEINIPLAECQAHRETVLDLMYPSTTEMDLSLAFPLYFASRGKGLLRSNDEVHTYSTAGRVFISGLGADEQLAGYARHRGAYQRDATDGLREELQKDLDRLPSRNLARDDRLISSHGREARYPYLDLSFVSYLSNLPLWIKCDLSREGGDKALLRAAADRLGLPVTSRRVKRAMQFGTRSAKMSGQDRPRARRGQQVIE